MSIVIKAGQNESSDSVIRKFQKGSLRRCYSAIQRLRVSQKDSQKRQERIAEKRRKIMRAKRFAQY